MRLWCSSSLLALLLVSAPVAAFGSQEAPQEAPAPQTDTQMSAPSHVAVIDGVASIEREGRAEPATASVPLVPGDRLKTAEGRVEVILTDGSVLDLDRHTTIDYQSETLIRLLEGRVFLTVAALNQGTEFTLYRIDAPGGAVKITAPGEFRVSASAGPGGSEVELAVLRGSAELVGNAGAMPVAAGERSVMREAGAPGFPMRFNSAMWDAFDRWVAMRRDARTGNLSARYLPQEVLAYSGAFDRYGSWRQDPAYGAVWYPYASATWRPYYNGNWRHYPSFGWTWVGFDAWTWPTHHYGRWGHARGSWFWIPARRWAPAWVHWAVAPGYVGWCPLGYDNRPLIDINAFGRDRYRVGAGYYAARGAYDPYGLWTFVPQHGFRSGALVRRHMIDGRTFDASVRSAVLTQAVPPGGREYAVPRGDVAPRTRVGTNTAVSPSNVRSGSPSAGSGFPSPGLGAGSRTSPAPSATPGFSRTSPAGSPSAGSGFPSPGLGAGSRTSPRAERAEPTPAPVPGADTRSYAYPRASTAPPPDARYGYGPRTRLGAPDAMRAPAPQTAPNPMPATPPSYGRGEDGSGGRGGRIAVPRGSAGTASPAPERMGPRMMPGPPLPPSGGGHSRAGTAVPRSSRSAPPPPPPPPPPPQ